MPPLACACDDEIHTPRLVVLTGGPGAGKTAVLEVIRRELCRHVVVLPEAASILWTGGFPRRTTTPARRSAQRAIVRLQIELQRMAIEEGKASLILCDRGTLDSLAYWPGEPDEFLADLDTTHDRELARYATVIQLRPPDARHGYIANGHRIESAEEAAAIDQKIERAWAGHPRHFVVESSPDFLQKLYGAIELIRAEVPPCCRSFAWAQERERAQPLPAPQHT
ncbi:MAG TPA: ATP-binding protein [Kofleriaceae bacterium]|nr:ATP-binding protein [Kofleriaceae bacterium]